MLFRSNMPDIGREMTAYEVSERMKQFRRENLPLFAPIEHEYSGRMCELAFETALKNGFLGSPQDIPKSLLGQDIRFKFESPLSESQRSEEHTSELQSPDHLVCRLLLEKKKKNNKKKS